MPSCSPRLPAAARAGPCQYAGSPRRGSNRVPRRADRRKFDIAESLPLGRAPCRSAPAFRPVPPATSTSAARARRSSTGSSPATTAARSCSASRTPIASAPRRRRCDEYLEGFRWLGLDWDEGPFFQTQRYPLYTRVRASRCSSGGKAYRCWCTAEELEARREAAHRGGPTSGLRSHLPRPHRRRRPAARAYTRALPYAARRRDRHRRPREGPHRLPERGPRRLHHPALRRHARLQLLRRRGRRRHAHHARDPRRRPRGQHAAPDPALSGARRRRCRSSPTCR